MSNSKFLLGVSVGLIVGVLFAQDAGKNTRKKLGSIRGKVKDLADSAADGIEGFKNDAEDMLHAGQNKVDHWKNRMSNSNT